MFRIKKKNMYGGVGALLFFALFAVEESRADDLSVTQLRRIFHEAVLDRARIPVFVQAMDNIIEPSAIEWAYKAAAQALRAQEEWNPLEKMSRLKRFESMMRQAILMDEQSLEIRFLRFGIAHHIPPVLGFSKDMKEDKMIILDGLSKIDTFNVDPYFAVYILNLLEDSRQYSWEEIKLVRSKILPLSSVPISE